MALSENPLTTLLRPYVEELKRDAAAGDHDAKQTIVWYQMHCAAPGDRMAPVICEEAFKAWKKGKAP